MSKSVENFIRVILIVLATARLTRFVTEDTLGHWTLVQPARRWAMHGTPLYHAHADLIDQEWNDGQPTTKRQRLVSGLDCRWCVGFWLGIAVLLTHRLPGVKWVLTALALNSVSNWVGERMGTLPD